MFATRKRTGLRCTTTSSSRRPSTRLACEPLEERWLLATFWVTKDSTENNAGSLRQAILDANANPGKDTIKFNIAGSGVHMIYPGAKGDLPEITDPVVIDGTTQPGFAGEPLIHLDDGGSGLAKGLHISAGYSVVKGLVISRFNIGIFLESLGYNVITGNYIGTNSSGTGSAHGNTVGVWISFSSSHNTVGGTATGDRNLISGSSDEGVYIEGDSNSVQGNYIGTDKTGTIKIPNQYGIWGLGEANVIGGTDAGAGNLISGNSESGVWLYGSETVIQGNYIGTNATGTKPLANDEHGIEIHGKNNTIGGTSAAARNVISGNGKSGVVIRGYYSTGNKVQGNYIGIDKNGTAAVPNLKYGVHIWDNAHANTIGGGAGLYTGKARNVISGNSFDGIHLGEVGYNGPYENLVYSNIIGLNALGQGILGNGGDGIEMNGARNNSIGREPSGSGFYKLYYGNTIGGNVSVGVRITGSSSAGNKVRGNTIGISGLGNGGSGVYISTAASDNSVGGPNSDMGNTIAGNSSVGVFVSSGSRNAIQRNSITGNLYLGIDLGSAGVTPNDLGDGDTGANQLQNFPVINSAVASGDLIIADVSLNSKPNTAFRVDFYGNSVCDASGYGEGATVLTAVTMTTNAQGNASATVSISASGVVYLTATATDPFNNTSEFSACKAVSGGTGPSGGSDGPNPPLWNLGAMRLDQADVPSVPLETRGFTLQNVRFDAYGSEGTPEGVKPVTRDQRRHSVVRTMIGRRPIWS